jgi:hypothetical protein
MTAPWSSSGRILWSVKGCASGGRRPTSSLRSLFLVVKQLKVELSSGKKNKTEEYEIYRPRWKPILYWLRFFFLDLLNSFPIACFYVVWCSCPHLVRRHCIEVTPGSRFSLISEDMCIRCGICVKVNTFPPFCTMLGVPTIITAFLI